ncbi:conserved Plasmodium protein, unknown function [Plasmodium malariae]|uniref:Uncharacterized protein n=1 Tax=Plasmodium malariae TaxID=5858 RepID=A0A1C3L2Z4_PLAMA|nr:conserved Plasmodium protein, unknown function [Plasmodium malariae]
MLSNAKKINYLKKILYREKGKKKKRNFNNCKKVYYNNIYSEKVSFSYKNKRLIQIIELYKKERSIFFINHHLNIKKWNTGKELPIGSGNIKNLILHHSDKNRKSVNNEDGTNGASSNSDVHTCVRSYIKRHDYIDDKSHKDDKDDYRYTAKKMNCFMNAPSCPNVKVDTNMPVKEIKNNYINKLSNEQNEPDMCNYTNVHEGKKKKIIKKKKKKELFHSADKNAYLLWAQGQYAALREKKSIIAVEKYAEQCERSENERNKLIIKYEMRNVNNLMTILTKCQEYNYVDHTLYDDIYSLLLLYLCREKNIDLKGLIEISLIFIKLNYINEEYFNYLFLHILSLHILSNDDLVPILRILSSIKKISILHVLFLYKSNFMLVHRLYSFSLYQLYNILNCYLKIYKHMCILKEHEQCAGKNDPHFCKISDNIRSGEKINSDDFVAFYKLNFEKEGDEQTIIKKKKNSIDFLFFLIDCLNRKKITIENISRIVNTYDCLQEPFFSYIKKKIGNFFLKKVKSEYVLYNRDERKCLYKVRDCILQKIQKESKNKETGKNEGYPLKINRTDSHIENGDLYRSSVNSPIVLENNILRSKAAYCGIKNSEIIQLKLIKKLKRKISARVFIPFIMILDNGGYRVSGGAVRCVCRTGYGSTDSSAHENACISGSNLYDFFYYNYKHMNLMFDPKNLVITLSCFSKKCRILSDEVLNMLTDLIKKKINYFNHEQIIDIMNSFSNIRNDKISNGIFNFLARFLFDNNKIIYLKDRHINILLNVLIKKKYFINEDVIHFICNFVVNHKPYYKNFKNIYIYFFFHFHFNKLNDHFLNSMYYSLLSKKSPISNFENLNKAFSCTLVLSSNIKYQKKIFALIGTSILCILKKINLESNTICPKYLKSIVDFIFYFNSSITKEVYKGYESGLKKIRKLSQSNGTIHFIHNTIYCKKMKRESNYNSCRVRGRVEKKKKKMLLYYCTNSYNNIYYMTASFDVRIFILIKKIFDKIFKQEKCTTISSEYIILLIKTMSNLSELQKKIMHIKKSYTYFYINQKWISKKNKFTNCYFLKIINEIRNNILLFLHDTDKEKIFFSNICMLRSNYIFEYLNNEEHICSYIRKSIDQIKIKKKVSTSHVILLMYFLSAYKIDEIILTNRSIKLKENCSNQGGRRAELEKLERSLIEAFLEVNKLKNTEDKREELISFIYNEKKRKKSRVKNVIKNFLLTYKFTDYNYLAKFQYKKNVYMNRIFNKYVEKKMLKRRIKKMDDMAKLNDSFKNINKYNKYLIYIFLKKWKKKKKKYLILKSTSHSGHINENNLIELLLSAIMVSIRYVIGNQNSNNHFSLYEKLIIFVLNQMILLKKPKIVNINYHIYFKLILCINALKYMFHKLFRNYFYILMYWKKVIGKNIGNEKTLRNYLDYAKSEAINEKKKLNIVSMSTNREDSINRIPQSCTRDNISLNEKIKNSKINVHNCSFLNLLDYPCISQTRYNYKLRENKYPSFENKFYFKNYSCYKNIVHHNIYEQFRFLQNNSHTLYLYIMYLKKRLMKKSNQQKRKKKKRNFKDKINLKCNKNKSILFKNNFKILDVKKIEFFHNHIIQVDTYKNDNTNVNTHFFFIYSSFNVNTIIADNINNSTQTKKKKEQTFFKREFSLTLFLAQIILHKKYLTGFNLIPICYDELNNIHSKKSLYIYLSTKLQS